MHLPQGLIVDLAGDQSSSDLPITRDSTILVSAPYHPQLGHQGITIWLYKDILKPILGLLYGRPLRFMASPLLLHFWVRFSMWQKISFSPVIQHGAGKPRHPAALWKTDRDTCRRVGGSVGWGGRVAVADDAKGWLQGSWGLGWNSGAPKSVLTHLQTEVSETFHCGPLRLFLLGSCEAG